MMKSDESLETLVQDLVDACEGSVNDALIVLSRVPSSHQPTRFRPESFFNQFFRTYDRRDEKRQSTPEDLVYALMPHVGAKKGEDVRRWLKKATSMAPSTIAKLPGSNDAPFGRYAFVDGRSASQLGQKGFTAEPDTSLEHDVGKELWRHFSANIHMSSSGADDLKKAMATGEYDDVLKSPSAKNVYRGMRVSKSWIRKLIGKSSLKAGDIVKVAKTYKPVTGHSSSWTTNRRVAISFARGDYEDDTEVPIIMHASVMDNSDSFVTGPGGLYKIDDFSEFEEEREVVGLGKIKIFAIEVV